MEFCIINELGNEPYQIDDSIQLVAYTDSLWKSEDKLIIAFVNGTNFEKEYFKSLTSEWLSLINLNVVFQDSLKNSVVRIKFNNSGIARSFLGRQAVLAPLNEPTLSLPRYVDSSKFRRNVLHEFGHVLGLVHEHQSPLNEIPWKKNFLYAKLILNGLSKRTIDKNFFSNNSLNKTQ